MSATVGEDEGVCFNFGDTAHFCPVTLERSGVLAPGHPDYTARFLGRLYRFRDDSARMHFQLAPYQYVSTNKPAAVPPPRLFFIGPSGSGKTVFARRIAKERGVQVVDFPELVRLAAEDSRHPAHQAAKMHVENPEEVDFGSDMAVETVKPLWKQEPYASKGFILENFPRNGLLCLYLLVFVPVVACISFSLNPFFFFFFFCFLVLTLFPPF